MLDCCLCIQELIGSLSHSVIPLIGSGVQEPLPLSGATSSASSFKLPASSFQLPAVHLQVFIGIIFILN